MEDINCWETKFELCSYSNRLLDKVFLLNQQIKQEVNIKEIKKSIYYAKKYHGSQLRKSGEPYYSHPIEVAYMVSDYLFNTDTIVTSILHDTIEDTAFTFEMISEIFNGTVALNVLSLSRITSDGRRTSSAEMLESLWRQKRYDILLIKLLDRLHNIQTIMSLPPEKAVHTLKETIKRFVSLSIYLKTKIPASAGLEDILGDLCYHHLFPKTQGLIDSEILFEESYQLPPLTFENDATLKHIQCLLES